MNCWQKKTLLEKKSLVTIIVLLIVFIALIALILVFGEQHFCESPSCIKSAKHILNLVDFAQDPCEQFDDFVCGDFHDPSSIPFHQADEISNVVAAIIQEPVKETDPKSIQLQKQYYHSCTDLTSIDDDDNKTLLDLINKHLGGWPVVTGNNWNKSAYDSIKLLVTLRQLGLPFENFFSVAVSTLWTNNNSTLYITFPKNINNITDNTKEHYVTLMAEVAMSFGAHDYLARTEMRNVMNFENNLFNLIAETEKEAATATFRKIYSIADIQNMWTKITWTEFLTNITNRTVTDSMMVKFDLRRFLPEVDKLLRQTDRRIQVNYVIWKVIEAYAPFLSKKIRDKFAKFALTKGEVDPWAKNRQTYCIEQSQVYFRFAVNAEYLRRLVKWSKRNKVEEIIERIRDQLEKKLFTATWLDDNTKRKAIEKLRNISYYIGGPDEMYYIEQFDNDIGVKEMEFKSSNIINITREITLKGRNALYQLRENLSKFIDGTLYRLVLAPEATFLRDRSLLYIPATLLHGFFYEDSRPEYLNYGTIGVIIGREMTHGFDTGTFKNTTWWSEQTTDNFNNVSQCLYQECGANASCTSELATYTGINLAYEAYSQWLLEHGPELTIPGLPYTGNQLFWIAYGTIMCHESKGTSREPSAQIVPPCRNSPHFAKAFQCPPNSKMNPAKKCQIL